MTGYKADAIGSGKKEAEEFFEKEYKEGLSVEEGITLALKALKKTTDTKLRSENVDIAYITKKEKQLVLLSAEETEGYLAKL